MFTTSDLIFELYNIAEVPMEDRTMTSGTYVAISGKLPLAYFLNDFLCKKFRKIKIVRISQLIMHISKEEKGFGTGKGFYTMRKLIFFS